MPAELGKLQALQTLGLGGTLLPFLPAWVSSLPKLQVLDVDQCARMRRDGPYRAMLATLKARGVTVYE